jgi:hypothetical protein
MSEVTARRAALDAPSYRARVLLGEYDWHNPEANTQVIGFKANNPFDAWRAAEWLAGKRLVLEIWRQDGSFCSRLVDPSQMCPADQIDFYGFDPAAEDSDTTIVARSHDRLDSIEFINPDSPRLRYKPVAVVGEAG